MTKIAKQLTELIGGTPLLELNKFSADKGLKKAVVAKVEYFNPDGSVRVTRTPKVTGKGQVYFINKYRNAEV